ncbi:HIRAN domain-containing protein [Candidatus Sulfurimonas marisnigri]|uniref:HIRAN domain-containing protein n=1 Tax=Candidatus Sulfurimonas marisnigri TaxID=2740405 RepID=A0A7S7M2F5_9BACT|nr:HIRAN domain-containing protein [Candidatus Sulfurimonas marisnigri]QOY55700.1 HIRAN domain-containing protein [Candidatus Sulfurimonas marisnigri]
MIINLSLESTFKSMYEQTDNKLLYKLTKQGQSHKEYKSIRKYFLKKIKDGDINTDDIHSFMELYRLPTKSLLIEQKKLSKITAKLFLHYLKEIKLPDSSFGVCLGEFYLAGTQFIDNMSELIQSLQINDKVVVVSEKNNPYDNRAVKVLTTDNIKLGYLPKKMNYTPSYILGNGNELFGFIKKLEWDKERFSIKIMLYLN